MTPITPTVIDNSVDGSIASYGTPVFKTFLSDTLTLCYDTITSFPYHYDLLGPCTDPEVIYDYIIDNLPSSWLEFTSDSATSTQTINILSSVPFGSAN